MSTVKFEPAVLAKMAPAEAFAYLAKECFSTQDKEGGKAFWDLHKAAKEAEQDIQRAKGVIEVQTSLLDMAKNEPKSFSLYNRLQASTARSLTRDLYRSLLLLVGYYAPCR